MGLRSIFRQFVQGGGGSDLSGRFDGGFGWPKDVGAVPDPNHQDRVYPSRLTAVPDAEQRQAGVQHKRDHSFEQDYGPKGPAPFRP